MAPGHGLPSDPVTSVIEWIWPRPLRLASWLSAAQRGLVPVDDALERAGVQGSALSFGSLATRGMTIVGVLAEPAAGPGLGLPPAAHTASLVDGGAVLACGPQGAVIVAIDGVLRLYEAPGLPIPPLDSLGVAERHLLNDVTEATVVLADLGLARPDDKAAAVLASVPRVLADYPMPPGTSGRAQLLRDRAALLVVGIELALAPRLDAPTVQLSAIRRDVLLAARRSGRKALETASNEAALVAG